MLTPHQTPLAAIATNDPHTAVLEDGGIKLPVREFKNMSERCSIFHANGELLCNHLTATEAVEIRDALNERPLLLAVVEAAELFCNTSGVQQLGTWQAQFNQLCAVLSAYRQSSAKP